MRKIKFRGRVSRGIANSGYWDYWGLSGTDLIHVIDPDTIGQYTGLKDKNGKEIYEGDIIYFGYGIPGRAVNAPVEFIGGAFYAITKGHNPDKCLVGELEEYVGEIEIIGNIYENPELLDQVKGEEVET